MSINFKFNIRIFVVSVAIFLVSLLLLLITLFKFGVFSSQEPIYIALVPSMDEGNQHLGKAALRGVQMRLDEINLKGGLNGKPVKLIPFDDRSEPKLATKVASDIVAQNQALIVLGHIDSETCLKAGKVYENAKIPAITPICMDDAVTNGNDWYFRMIPDNKFRGIFLANYVKKVMKYDTISLIQDEHAFSVSIAKSFESSFQKMKGIIKNKWIINRQDNLEKQVEEITNALQEDNSGLIFMPVDTSEIKKKFLVSIKRQN
jgi:branched-chain amino acid transport system substrate-binding protein